jgi:hypothetical protein
VDFSEHGDDPPYWIESIDSSALEKTPSQQLSVYAEQKRQAGGVFNICLLFAIIGALQALAGIATVFCHCSSPVGTGVLLSAGGIFAALSNWAYKISDNANTRLDRIASDEKARELIGDISDRTKRNEEIGKFLEVLANRAN